MSKPMKKSISDLLVSMLAIITLFTVFMNVPGLNVGKILAQEEGVISTG